MYDNTCKFLAETFPTDIATWLLGEPVSLTKLEASELSVEPIRPDAMILLESDSLILHVEFQTIPKADMPFRVTDYRLRGYRRYPDKQMRQVVVYLRRSQSELVYQTAFELPNLRCEFEVIRLWEQPTKVFLNLPGLLPFAVLSQTSDRSSVLQAVADRLEGISDDRQRANVAAASAILSGLVLERDFILQVLRRDIMQESVIYQEILQEGERKGKQEGLEEGLKHERSLVFRLLNRKLGNVPLKLRSQIESLPLSQLETLGEDLLDFSSPADLTDWLRSHA